MAQIGIFQTNNASGPGWWSDMTMTTSVVVTGTASASSTILYSNTSARVFQPSLPVGCIALTPATATSAATVSYTTLQNGVNTGLPAGIGISSVVLGTSVVQTNTSTGLLSYTETGTLTLGFVNYAATATITSGTRLLFIQSQGN
jgi:hypothetical protein